MSRFDRDNIIRALVLEFPSNVRRDASYERQRDFYNYMNVIMEKELNTAPPGLQSGWFVSDLEVYSLQEGLLRGTVSSLVLALAVALVVVFLTTLNLVVSVLASLTIGATIVTVTGLMCYLGWELNVLESITVSVSVGLSVDFTAHYAVGYLLAPHKGDRERRVEHATTRLSPAITVAAITTFVAGLGLMPSSVLAYNKFGTFLMMVMFFSWFYSVFLFLGLLAAFGPQHERCGLDRHAWIWLACCCCCCCCGDNSGGGGDLGDSGDMHRHEAGRDLKHTTTTTAGTETSSFRGIAATSSGSSGCHVPHERVVERSTVI